MRVPGKSVKTAISSEELVAMIERLRVTLDIGSEAWSDILRVTPKEYGRIKAGLKPLSATSLVYIIDKFNLSAEALFAGKIDYSAAAAHYHGNIEHIPERFMVAATSRRRTALNILDYVEKNAGWQTALLAKRHFQINDAALVNKDGYINIIFMTELLDYFRSKGLNANQLMATGSYNTLMNRETPLGAELSALGTPSAVYETMLVDRISYLEKNCDYKILRLNKNSCVLQVKSKRDVADALGLREIGSENAYLYKAGVFSATPSYLGLPFADVKETSCVHKGGSSCRFEVDYSRASYISHAH